MVKSLNHLVYNLERLRAEGVITSDKVLLCTADATLVEATQSMGTSSHMVCAKLNSWLMLMPTIFCIFLKVNVNVDL